MRRPAIRLVSAMLVAAGGEPLSAQAGGDATAQGRSTAHVVQPIVVSSLADLSFGSITVSPRSDGTVIVGALMGDISYRGSARGVCSGASACSAHPALFGVRGESGRRYSVQVPAVLEALGARASSPRLPISRLAVRSESLPGEGAAGRLGDSGDDRFGVGGTLSIPAGTGPDLFRAVVPVTVSYD
jgi:hypothetical protein